MGKSSWIGTEEIKQLGWHKSATNKYGGGGGERNEAVMKQKDSEETAH